MLSAFASAHSALIWALVAAILAGGAFLIVVYIGVITHTTTMHYMYIIGSLLMPTGTSFMCHTMGFAIHMSALSIILGLVHQQILQSLQFTSVGQAITWELIIGAVQGVLFVLIIPVLLDLKKPPTRWAHINNPGFLLLGYGWVTPLLVLAENIAFGVVFGTVYAAALLPG